MSIHSVPRGARPLVLARLVRLRGTALAVVGFLVVIAAWAVAADAYASPLLFPGPGEVFERLRTMMSEGVLGDAVGASVGRAAAGLAVGTLLGVLLGLATGTSRILEALVEPFVNVFRFIPPLAWYAPVLLWLGTGEPAKISLIVYTSVFVVTVNTAAGVRAVPRDKLRMAASMGASAGQRFWQISLPGSAPYIAAGVRIAIGNALMTVVTAEMLGASEGLGVIVTTGMATTNLPSVFVALVVLGTIGLIVDRLFVAFLRRFGRRLGATPEVRR